MIRVTSDISQKHWSTTSPSAECTPLPRPNFA